MFQAFFSEITYQKSIVESKNKVYEKVKVSKNKLKNVDFSPLDQSVQEMNTRFQVRGSFNHFCFISCPGVN